MVIDCATISMAWFSSLCFLTNASEQMIVAAPPSEVGQHIPRVSCSRNEFGFKIERGQTGGYVELA